MANVKNSARQIRGIREKLMQTLKELKEKIAALEAERAKLLLEVEGLRKAAQARVDALEVEVGQIRQEAQSLRELVAEKPPSAVPSIQILPGSN